MPIMRSLDGALHDLFRGRKLRSFRRHFNSDLEDVEVVARLLDDDDAPLSRKNFGKVNMARNHAVRLVARLEELMARWQAYGSQEQQSGARRGGQGPVRASNQRRQGVGPARSNDRPGPRRAAGSR